MRHAEAKLQPKALAFAMSAEPVDTSNKLPETVKARWLESAMTCTESELTSLGSELSTLLLQACCEAHRTRPTMLDLISTCSVLGIGHSPKFCLWQVDSDARRSFLDILQL